MNGLPWWWLFLLQQVADRFGRAFSSPFSFFFGYVHP
jgi:hypothetical protein